jgi:hypothetical protein
VDYSLSSSAPAAELALGSESVAAALAALAVQLAAQLELSEEQQSAFQAPVPVAPHDPKPLASVHL